MLRYVVALCFLASSVYSNESDPLENNCQVANFQVKQDFDRTRVSWGNSHLSVRNRTKKKVG